MAKPPFATCEIRRNTIHVTLNPAYRSEVGQLLVEVQNAERAEDTSKLSPDAVPTTSTLLRLMLEELIKRGKIDFDTFSKREDVKSKAGDGSRTRSYLPAVGVFLQILNLPLPKEG